MMIMTNKDHKILLTGANGQLGFELQRTAPAGTTIVATDVGELDITNAEAVEILAERTKPNMIINAAAYTAVDKAEQEQGEAYAINAEGAAHLASAAHRYNARLVHISTDFVFDGKKSTPYLPADTPIPLSVYGASKLKGEQRVREITQGDALIVRTAWVYSSHGANFVKTMLRLMREREQLGVVSDQIGSPTWTKGLANAIWGLVAKSDLKGVYHWTDAGVASWYDFAVAIQEEALQLGLLDKTIPIRPILTTQYPTPATRPAYSVLDKTATWAALETTPIHWREQLRQMLMELS
ncbi:MAG: dTDP-4-dehydrorhamnose reductase [Pseudomonadota bacterium]